MTLTLELIGVGLLVLLNGFFVAAEYALVTARRTVIGVQVQSLQLPGTSRRDLAARCEAAVRGDVSRQGHGHALVA